MNYLLANLAIADITVAIFMVVDQIFFHAVHHPAGVAGDYLCKVLTGKNLTWVGSVASVCTLLAIAFERFYAIVLPYHNRSRGRMTNKKICLIVVFCWTFALLFNAPLFAVRKFNHDQLETGYFCRSYWPNEEIAIAYNYLWVIFIGVIPVGLMFFFYANHVAANAARGKSNMAAEAAEAADKNFTWSDEEINLLLNVVIDYKARKAGEGVDWETVMSKYEDVTKMFLEKYPHNDKEKFPRLTVVYSFTKSSVNL
ncbi:hypothetical protein ACROYT_G037611 [Oculina patagonica]